MFKDALKSKINITILIVIAIAAISLSIITFQYSVFTSNQVVQIASQDIRTNARIETNDLSHSLANELESVTSNLDILANAPIVQTNEYEKSKIIINAADDSSSPMVDFYMWLDKNGKIVWISNINQTIYQKYKGFDLSYRPYFTVPRQIHTTYYSSTIESNDNIPRLYISYPIIINKDVGGNNNNATTTPASMFNGVMVAGIKTDALGDFLKNQLLPEFKRTIELLDKNGIILYTTNNQSYYTGKYVFGKEFQSTLSTLLTPDAKNSLNDLLKRLLQGNTGSKDIFGQGIMNTVAYEPIRINGEYFLTLYVSMPHYLVSNVSDLINQQKNFSTLIVIAIGMIAVAIAFLVLSWNKRLEMTVNARTQELKVANEQLKYKDKMQREFINIAAHELRTPIQPIIGLSDFIYHKIKDNESRELLDVIFRNAKRLQRLSEDILDVTKIESKSLQLNKERFNLNEVISNVVEDYKNQIKNSSRNIKLVYEFNKKEEGEEHPLQFNTILIEADKARIIQVISNLLSNALKFTKEGIISITAEKKDSNEAIVTVKDTGEGIDPELLPRLFTKFTSKSFEGTGLGLFICKSIIETHGGRIWAENNKDGKGATFTFSLPLTNSALLQSRT